MIGYSVDRIDAVEKALGRALYPADRKLEGMCYADVLLAGRPSARIRCIDSSKALAVPGAIAVLTAADVPHNVLGLIVPDQPVLCSDLVHHIGDKVAVVVAETPEALQCAVQAVLIDYEDLPAVTDPAQALLPGAPLVHPDTGTNLILESSFSNGNVQAGFAQADVIVENTYHTGGQEHAFLDPEAGLAYRDADGRVIIETAGQWAHDDRRQVAAALQLPEDQVRIIYRAIGGAFGGREDISVQAVLGLAAWKLGRPVKMVWTRQQSMMAHHKRHPITYRARLGATRQGILVAAEVDVLADGGAYSSTSIPVLANAMLFSTGPYRIPNVCVSGKVVYTHNLPCGAMRGFGALQGNFCAEMQMTHLADALGMDPVELRARNLVTQDDSLPNGARLPEGAMAAELCLQEAASASGWKRIESPHTGTWHAPVRREAPGSRRVHGIGFACGWKNVGLGAGVPDAAETVIELYGGAQIENVLIRNASADVGQGVQTVMAQIAASVLQVRIEQIHFAGSDTLNSPPSGTSSASRLTLMVGNSVLLAAQDALRAWRDREERPAIGRGVYEAFPTHPQHATPPGELTHYSLGYTAGCAKVEVDLDTGQVTLLSYTSALDAGKAINPCQVEGQTHGGLTQAIGWTLTENLVQREGRLLSNDLTTYLIPTSVDIPKRIKVILLETADPMGPFGARGIGELPMLTVAPAILAAIRDACGAWLDQVPALAEDVWRKLSAMKP